MFCKLENRFFINGGHKIAAAINEFEEFRYVLFLPLLFY